MEKMKLFGDVKDEQNNKEIGKPKTAAFGIDLGTTNSAISVIPKGTEPLIIPLKDKRTTIPSCVLWDSDTDTFIVGKEAYEQRYKSNCIYSVKRLMQTADAKVVLKDKGKTKIMTPAEVSAEILKGLVAETGGVYGDIKDVVITVPAKFNEIGRSNTRKAAELAGLNVLGIIAEPTAASMCYELTPKDDGSRTIIVYDLGGGTFDVSVVRITNGRDYTAFEDVYNIPKNERKHSEGTIIRAIDGDGDVNLGGDDIDREIYDNLVQDLKSQGFNTELISTEEENRLILAIEKAKKFNINNTTILCVHLIDGSEVTYSLGYEQFKAGLLPTYFKTIAIISKVLKRNREKTDSIVLVGGSTKNPILKELLMKDFPGHLINDALPQDEAVALGAGIHARLLKFGDNNIAVFDSLVDSIGVRNLNTVSTIIPSGSQFPVTKYKVYETLEDNQEEIEVDIVQGNTTFAAEACKLGTLVIDKLPKGKKGEIEIMIRLSIDVRGLLKCSVKIYNVVTKEPPVERELELKLNAGNVEQENTLSKDAKMKIRWMNFADTLSGSDKEEFIEMVNAYPHDVTAKEIQAKIMYHRKK